MPSDYQHIDDFIRDKEEAYTLPAGTADLHWQDMQQLIRPGIHPMKPARNSRISYFLKYAAAVIFCTAIVFLFRPGKKHSHKNGEDISIASKPLIRIPVKDSSAAFTDPLIVPGNNTAYVKKTSTRQTVIDNRNKVDTGTVKIQPNGLITEASPVADDHTVFTQFFRQLEKPAEQFMIQANRDTTIYCREGTRLFIPAGCFQTVAGLAITGVITLQVQEFYRFADIAGNKLSTVSNGQPLTSGGMLNIRATAQAQPVLVKPGSGIGLEMPARNFDPDMQLFVENGSANLSLTPGQSQPTTDTIASAGLTGRTIVRDLTDVNIGGINWMPVGQQQVYLKDDRKMISILNLIDNPYNVVQHRNGKTTAKFRIPYNSPHSIDFIKTQLEKRYGSFYDKIKVKREWAPLFQGHRIDRWDKATAEDEWYETKFVGDSVRIPLSLACRLKLITQKDSLRYEQQFHKAYEAAMKRNESYKEWLQVKDSYRFKLSGLGWINCDRFWNYPENQLSLFAVRSDEVPNTSFYHALAILEDRRAALPGYLVNGRIEFGKLPVGENVHIICLVPKEGKMYMALSEHRVVKKSTPELVFKEVTPEQFKEQLERELGSVK